MPKMKSNSSAKKRFKITGTGKVRRGKAGGSHLLRGKSANRLRRLRKNDIASSANEKHVKRLLPGS